ncbi:lytic transglycosylase domain-containing protein (plasmid) [Moraxella bovis]|uniref:Lytic transglycosylase domain-containing protein n=1 Tax=Moraxella bovis TaxID=476 RepID=A0ABY6MEK9_MORBO|nr:lytic transglycosylase domain-containing protein [Moraxella bovis]UYZ77106.1 lytic transglycosylase domain-containing protein [Moraxella bovis]UYZ79796.1 lytic transglycosylase domain-containing protein [Moraxella bovis]UYZ88275.1 lytic transglycosylase domain-containing protein [Moraxella bovis]UYZ90979.1 lytic transglycosylase domain-containing protein [Moraxella bovis]UYZ99217.1 lytic transglycosylase domain-containing protein [Moraxella bovis]
MLDMALVTACSPQMHPAIVNAIAKTESGFNPFAIGVNKGAGRLTKQPTSYNQAVSTAKALLARGANIDMGLGQINSANLGWLKLSVEQVFDPCTNLKAMQTVYNTCYANAGSTGKGTRMQRAWSCYNTGNSRNGFSNGYVNKVTGNYNYFVQRLQNPATKPVLPQPTYQVPNQIIVERTENASMPLQAQNGTLVAVDDLNLTVSDLNANNAPAQNAVAEEKPKNPNGNVFLMQKSSIFNVN